MKNKRNAYHASLLLLTKVVNERCALKGELSKFLKIIVNEFGFFPNNTLPTVHHHQPKTQYFQVLQLFLSTVYE